MFHSHVRPPFLQDIFLDLQFCIKILYYVYNLQSTSCDVNYNFGAKTGDFVAMQKFKIMRGTSFRDPRMSFSVRSTGHFYTWPPDKEKFCIHDFCEIFWCMEGSGTFRLNGSSSILSPGEVWYYPPGSFHEYFPGKNGFHYCWLTIEGPQAALLIEGTGVRPGLNFGGDCPVHLFALLEKLLPVSNKKTQMECLAAAFEIITLICPENTSDSTYNSPALHAKCIIDSNYTRLDLSVEMIAAKIKIHRSTLSRIFLSVYSMTVHGYITLCRIKYAEMLLRDTDSPQAEIARLAGFSSAAYFSKVFTGKIGISPGQYRKLNHKHEPSLPKQDDSEKHFDV